MKAPTLPSRCSSQLRLPAAFAEVGGEETWGPEGESSAKPENIED